MTAQDDRRPVWVVGNTAKLYCLDLLADLIRARGDEEFRIVDLGAGTGENFVALLRAFENLSYVAVEPSADACTAAATALRGLRARVVNAAAYGVDVGEADAVTSFSVLEHVYRRADYMTCLVRHLRSSGTAFINYDAGHFVGTGPFGQRVKEHTKTVVGQALARLGRESKYQSFVREEDFRSLVGSVGLTVVDERMFNTDLKRAWRAGTRRRPELMRQWLDLELAMGEGVDYDDHLASIFRTRNFVLRRRPAGAARHP
jgi:SAM-dependent methyltransferase